MNYKNQHSGFAIAIAWPETFCKQPGSWYDGLLTLLRLNQNNYYQVGHAAIILVDDNTGQCNFFDFGRYHTPFQHGRVRGSETDFDLIIKTKALISKDKKSIINYKEILQEVQQNPASHGEGSIHASYCRINYKKAINKALLMQHKSPMKYGPFTWKGTNCSRFVSTIIQAGRPGVLTRLNLRFMVILTPSPIGNVNTLNNIIIIPKLLQTSPFIPKKKLEKEILKSTLPKPKRPDHLVESVQWLSGEGAGSWFEILFEDHHLTANRYSHDGDFECSATYEKVKHFNISNNNNYSITYPSNCKVITIKTEGKILQFERKDSEN